MTRRDDPFFEARLEAEKLLKELEINKAPINPFEIARRLDIELRPLPSNAGGVSGMLLHIEGQFGIGYPTHVYSEGFKKFSVAHEIGHFRLPGHLDAILDGNGQHVSSVGFRSDDRYEKEADHFAAALLMPTTLFTASIKRAGDGLKAIETLAGEYETSLEATAIRYVQLSRDPVAMIRSEGRTIDYAFMSEALKDFPDLDWIRKKTPLPTGSVTASFNANKTRVELAGRSSGKSDLQDWFDGPHSQEVVEEIIGLGNYGKTITVLTGMEPPDEIEDDDDELEKSWAVNFPR